MGPWEFFVYNLLPLLYRELEVLLVLCGFFFFHLSRANFSTFKQKSNELTSFSMVVHTIFSGNSLLSYLHLLQWGSSCNVSNE